MQNMNTKRLIIGFAVCIITFFINSYAISNDWTKPPYEFKENQFQVDLFGRPLSQNTGQNSQTGASTNDQISVDVTTGQVRYIKTLLNLGGNGSDLPLIYQRIHTSEGWRDNHYVRLYANFIVGYYGIIDTIIVIRDGFGSEMRWTISGEPEIGATYEAKSRAAYLSKLEYTTEGFIWTKPNGLKYVLGQFMMQYINTLVYAVSEISDRHGNIIKYTYENYKIKTILSEGRQLNLEYTGDDQYTLQYFGQTWLIDKDTITDPMRNVTEAKTAIYSWTIYLPAKSYVYRITDQKGYVYDLHHDEIDRSYLNPHRLTRITAPDASITQFEYPNEDLTRITDARGNVS